MHTGHCKSKWRDLGLFNLEKRRVRGPLISACEYVKCENQMGGAGLSSVPGSGRTRGNRQQKLFLCLLNDGYYPRILRKNTSGILMQFFSQEEFAAQTTTLLPYVHQLACYIADLLQHVLLKEGWLPYLSPIKLLPLVPSHVESPFYLMNEMSEVYHSCKLNK